MLAGTRHANDKCRISTFSLSISRDANDGDQPEKRSHLTRVTKAAAYSCIDPVDSAQPRTAVTTAHDAAQDAPRVVVLVVHRQVVGIASSHQGARTVIGVAGGAVLKRGLGQHVAGCVPRITVLPPATSLYKSFASCSDAIIALPLGSSFNRLAGDTAGFLSSIVVVSGLIVDCCLATGYVSRTKGTKGPRAGSDACVTYVTTLLTSLTKIPPRAA